MNFEQQPGSNFEDEKPKIENFEMAPSPEQKKIIESAERFIEYLTSHWPQVDENRKIDIETEEKGKTVELPALPDSIETEPRLNYYLSGSLATMLLSKAESFTELDESQVPDLKEARTRNVPEKTRQILATFARPMGDLDYVPTDFYKGKQALVQDSYDRVGNDEYQKMRAQYLWKGAGPKFDAIPEDAKKCLKREESQTSVMCDPVESYGARRIAKISLDGNDYYIARPDTIFAYKILHLLQAYDQKPDKFNTDFSKLLMAMKEMYGEEELLQVAREVLTDYENTMLASYNRNYKDASGQPYEPKIPSFSRKVLSNQNVTPEIRGIIEKINMLR